MDIRLVCGFLFLSFSNFVLCQKIDSLVIQNTDSIYTLNSLEKTIYFVCPVRNCAKTEYWNKFNELLSKKKIKKIKEVNFTLVFFNENVKNRSKGLKLKFGKSDSVLYVNEFRAYFHSFQRNDLLKTIERIDISKRYGINFYGDSSLADIFIAEDVSCFSKLSELIPNYEEFISQLINPVYSTEEQIVMLNQKNIELTRTVNLQNEKIALIISELDSLKQEIEKQNQINEITIDSNEIKKEKPKVILNKKEKQSKNLNE